MKNQWMDWKVVRGRGQSLIHKDVLPLRFLTIIHLVKKEKVQAKQVI